MSLSLTSRTKLGMLKDHIISHTHWNRKRHRLYEYFRGKFVFVIDSLLSFLENDSYVS